MNPGLRISPISGKWVLWEAPTSQRDGESQDVPHLAQAHGSTVCCSRCLFGMR